MMCEGALHKDCAIKEDGKHYCDGCYTIMLQTPKKVEYEIPEHIRRTYIETYRTCPYKFLKEVLEGNAQPPTCYTQVGIDLHELFEKALLDRTFTASMMREAFQVYWDGYSDDLFKDEEQRMNMAERAEASIKTFYTILPGIPTPFTTEETIFYSIGEDLPLVRFTMDLVTENEAGNLEMHDWKTGGVMVGKKISTDLQAPLYIYGVQRHFNRQVDKFTFYYLKDNKTRTFHRVNDDEYVCTVGKRQYIIKLTDAIREVKSMFSQIKKGNFNIPKDTRSMYYACKMCHIKEQGMCQGADEQVWTFR